VDIRIVVDPDKFITDLVRYLSSTKTPNCEISEAAFCHTALHIKEVVNSCRQYASLDLRIYSRNLIHTQVRPDPNIITPKLAFLAILTDTTPRIDTEPSYQSSQTGSLTGQLKLSLKSLELAIVPRMRAHTGEWGSV
jgi:hypothetical protein